MLWRVFLTVTLEMISDSRRLIAFINVIHFRLILQEVRMSLLKWPTRKWRWLLPDYRWYFKLGNRNSTFRLLDLSASEQCLPVSLIIRWVSVQWEATKTCFFTIKTWKDAKESRICSPAPNSSDLSIGTKCIQSQSRDFIPLMCKIA
jgi:hypothetical protein